MRRESDEVERPFVEQLTATGWRYLAGDLDTPHVRQDIEGPVTPRSGHSLFVLINRVFSRY